MAQDVVQDAVPLISASSSFSGFGKSGLGQFSGRASSSPCGTLSPTVWPNIFDGQGHSVMYWEKVDKSFPVQWGWEVCSLRLQSNPSASIQ